MYQSVGGRLLVTVGAGYVVEIVFDVLHLVPTGPRHAKVIDAHVSLNYTSVLNVVFLLLARMNPQTKLQP